MEAAPSSPERFDARLVQAQIRGGVCGDVEISALVFRDGMGQVRVEFRETRPTPIGGNLLKEEPAPNDWKRLKEAAVAAYEAETSQQFDPNRWEADAARLAELYGPTTNEEGDDVYPHDRESRT